MTLCDAGGNWLESVIVPANIGERAGALLSFEKVQAAWWSGQLSLIWADEGFGGEDFEAQVKKQFGWTLGIGAKEPGQKGSACNANAGSSNRSLAAGDATADGTAITSKTPAVAAPLYKALRSTAG
jgi:hypothetical protein